MKLNIRQQFLFYTLGIVLAVAAGLATWTVRNGHHHELAEFERGAQNVTRMMAGSVANDLYFLDLAAIRQKLRTIAVNPSIVSAQVFDSKGVELVASGRHNYHEAEPGFLQDLIAQSLQPKAPVTRQDGTAVHAATAILLPDSSLAGYMVVHFSLDQVNAHNEEATQSVLLATGVAVVLAGFLALVVGWYFARPIVALKDAALAVSRGELDTRTTLKRSDEIGQLAQAVNTMADRLIDRFKELETAHVELNAAKDTADAASEEVRELNRTLERRVVERTAELHAAQQALVQKERLSALGQLTATVAHELRNPLSVIQNTVFTMKQVLENKGITLERPVARIERSIGRCNRIISDLLDYSRQRELQRENRSLDEWLSRVVAEQVPPEKVRIELDLRATGLVASFDQERLRRVAINLIDNAVQAVAENGEGRSAEVVVGTRALSDGVEMFVRDNGPGIREDVLPRIFEPLFSTKSFGTGLGLPTVKQIVEAHGGRIDIVSQFGEGTSVRVWLPSSLERTAA
jgi:signal transduction histidine kinase